jgi:predicted GIY-YIG superfamily endonuclease
MGYYIYKYVNNNVVEYIGQTTDLERRIKQHQQDKLKNFHGQIYYFTCKNKTEMNGWEYFLINKYHPCYNVALKNENTIIKMEEPEWSLYMEITKPEAKSNIVNFADYVNSRTVQKPIVSNKIVSTGKPVKQSDDPDTIVISGNIKGQTYIRFTCRRCRTDFKTVNWYNTATGFGAHCPGCGYAAWSRG